MSDFIALWPGAASAYSREVDLLIGAFTVLIVALSAPVFILIVVFATKYRRGKPANRRTRRTATSGWRSPGRWSPSCC